ncbi:MAG: hypothetical protein L0170_05220, partial [Acidobacteria bacterium]|nr:hypothetical protein [Acidobacteriota bacterium]
MTKILAVVDGTIRESMAKFTFLAFVLMSTLILMIITFAVNLDVVDGALATARLFGQDIGERTRWASSANPLTSLLASSPSTRARCAPTVSG